MKLVDKDRTDPHFFEKAYRLAPLWVAQVSKYDICEKTNPMIRHVLGYTEEVLLLLPYQELVSAEDFDIYTGNKQLCLESKSDSFSMEIRYIRKDKRLISALLQASITYDEQMEPLHAIHFVTDIMENQENKIYTLRKNICNS